MMLNVLMTLKLMDNQFLILQRCQIGNVENELDFNVCDGQHGKGIYSFKKGDKAMINYYLKGKSKLYTFKIDKKFFIDLSYKTWDYWEAKTFIYNNPQYKAFMFKHKGCGIPTSKEILITDSSVIQII